MPDIQITAVPGEALLKEIVSLARDIIKDQPPDVKAELWRIHIEDVKWWRRLFGLKIPGEE